MPVFIDHGRHAARMVAFSSPHQLSLGGDGLAVKEERRVPLDAGMNTAKAPAHPFGAEPVQSLVIEPLRGLDALLVMVPIPSHVTAVRTACHSVGLNVRWESLNTQVVGGDDLVSLLEQEAVPGIVTRVGQAYLGAFLDALPQQRQRGYLQQLVLWSEAQNPPPDWRSLEPEQVLPWPSGQWSQQARGMSEQLQPVFGALWAGHPEVCRLQEHYQHPAHHKPRSLVALTRCWSAIEEHAPFSLYLLDPGRVSHYRMHEGVCLVNHSDVWGTHSPGIAPPEAWGAMTPAAQLQTLPTAKTVSRWLHNVSSLRQIEDVMANALLFPSTRPHTHQELMIQLALVKAVAQRSDRVAQHNTTRSETLAPSQRILFTGEALPDMVHPVPYLLMLLDVASPRGVVALYGDPHGVAALLGSHCLEGHILEPRWPHEQSPLPHLATCIAPHQQGVNWETPSDHTVAIIKVDTEGHMSQLLRLRPGGLVRLPQTAGRRIHLTIEPARHYDFGAGRGRTWKGDVQGGRWGLVCDTRGRPLRLPATDLLRISRLRDWEYGLSQGGEDDYE